MYYPRKRSGSMPAVQARPRRTRGGMQLLPMMRITIGMVMEYGAISKKPAMWAVQCQPMGLF